MNKKPIVLSFLSLFIAWSLVALVVDSPVLPVPWEVIYTFVLELPTELGRHILTSGYRILVSMFLATAIGMPLGLMLGQNKRLDRIVFPFVYATYPIPKVALLPILILLLGIGEASKIFLITLILFFQVLVIVRDASRNIPPELILSLRSLGANWRQLLRYVYLPASLPATLTSLRLNTAIAIAVLYLVESFATFSGLGYYVMDSWQQVSYTKMYAAVMAMSFLGAAAFISLAFLEERMCRWTKAGK